MYTSSNLSEDLAFLEKIMNEITNNLENLNKQLIEKYMTYDFIFNLNMTFSRLKEVERFSKEMKVQDIYSSGDNSSYTEELLKKHKDILSKFYSSRDNYELLLTKYPNFRELAELVRETLTAYDNLCPMTDEEFQYIYKQTTHFMMVNKIVPIPMDEEGFYLDEMVNIFINIDDSKVQDYLVRLDTAIDEIEKENAPTEPTKKYNDTGFYDFTPEASTDEYDEIENALKKIQRNKGGF